MSKLKEVENKVYEVLKTDPMARKDDFRLILQVFKKYEPDIAISNFANVMLGHNTLGLPAFESITRARRKIQATFPWLKDEDVADFRAIQEEEYKNYARN